MENREPVRKRQTFLRTTPAQVYAVVTDFAAYPRLFPELKAARVLSTTGDVVRVEFRAQIVLPVRYVLDLTCRPGRPDGDAAAPPAVDWVYVEGEVVTGSTGAWRFTAQGADTVVEYLASLDVKAPVPAFILRKVTDGLVSASLPNMFASIERELRRRQAAPA
jgi:ribosome-associated toxin RatA of RatAB toxin-antitoxin module